METFKTYKQRLQEIAEYRMREYGLTRRQAEKVGLYDQAEYFNELEEFCKKEYYAARARGEQFRLTYAQAKTLTPETIRSLGHDWDCIPSDPRLWANVPKRTVGVYV